MPGSVRGSRAVHYLCAESGHFLQVSLHLSTGSTAGILQGPAAEGFASWLGWLQGGRWVVTAQPTCHQSAWLLSRRSAASLAERLPSDGLVQELRALTFFGE